ncbi:hypothetical protein ACFE04_014734 [Oxalis oulophora]
MAATLPFTPSFTTPPLTKVFKPKSKSSRVQATATVPQPLPINFTDPLVLQLAESIEDSHFSISSSSPLQKLRDTSSETLLSTPWPTKRNEAFRYVDTSFIKKNQITPITNPDLSLLDDLEDTQLPSLVFVDGFLVKLQNLDDLPNGVYVGSLSGLSDERIVKRVSEYIGGFEYGDMFWSINGLGAPDLAVVYVPEWCKVENPIHLKYFSVEGGSGEGSKNLPVSNPRVVVVVERGGEVGIIEEFVGKEENQFYWTNSVLEVVVGEGAKVKHSYLQSQSVKAAHVKWTSVRQELHSTYELVEVSTGGKLSRHNAHIQQLGPDTATELSTFHLTTCDQTQDLHSKIVLDHPRGYCRQLHKCIVAHSSGQAVFDGNIQVNSDLEESQLFYFQSRGVGLKTAKQALTFAFGAEVIERLHFPSVKELARSTVKDKLESTRVQST